MIGERNVTWGWVTMVLGAVSGSILMAWSFAGPFPPPPGFEDYTSLPRRLARLAHVALFMLPLINVVLGRELDRLPLSRRSKELTSWFAIVGMIGIPTGLLLGALVDIRLKYVALPAVTLLLLALAVVARGAALGARSRAATGHEPAPPA